MKKKETFEELLKKAAKRNKSREGELISASNVTIEAKDWLWEGHLLRGAQELLSGLPGLGKSQVQINFVACVTAGLPWPDGAPGMAPANVIMLTAEDVLGQEVVPRLLAAGADLSRVQFLKCIKSIGETDRQFLLGEDLDVLERAVARVGNVALITIDPITAYMGGQIDSHKTTEVRSQLGPLKDFAERMNIAISTITHPPKSSSQKAIDHFIGSQAFIAAGRIGHVCIEEVAEDGEKTGRILFANAKNNPHTKMPTLAYRVEETTVSVKQNPFLQIKAPRVAWEKDAVDITADEAVRAAAGVGGDHKQRGKQDEVQEFLREALKGGGPVQAKVVIEEAVKLGFTPEQLRTARKKLHVVVEQPKGGNGWVWQLIPF